ncbi:MarR family transcriptional regulator [uncultured Cohaesibacter sp.]|uniref:MarR family winged helix-turn-helix transcriptional regulator n=1 Tax=uncultured Cohaesibacter sp. TaxID=1002546 RepID=UPI002AAC0CA0|nr:MarR family transcriptional regulator [uncultured Cohaesibacter sp.]
MTSIDDFERGSPIRKISILHRLNLNRLSAPLSQMGIMQGSFPFLMEILSRGTVIQEEITQALSIDRAATTRAMQILEKNGLIIREDDPKDKRCKLINPTQKSIALQADILTILQQQIDTLFDGFSEEEREQFSSQLDLMIDNMRNKKKKNLNA